MRYLIHLNHFRSLTYPLFFSIGYYSVLFARPELYSLLFKRIPPHKIHMSKKVLSFQQNHEGVMLLFSDNTTIHGDILVGADGAYSSVRQHLYKILEKQGQLPKTDKKQMEKGYISLVGTTDPLDPAKYPRMGDRDSDSVYIIGGGKTPYTVRLLRQSFLSLKNAARIKLACNTNCSVFFLSTTFNWF